MSEVALPLIVVLSLGLWATIWLAVSSMLPRQIYPAWG
jgi:hypothetical protein